LRAAITRFTTLERIGNPKRDCRRPARQDDRPRLSQSFSRAMMGLRCGSTEGRRPHPGAVTFSWVPYPKGSTPSLVVRRIEVGTEQPDGDGEHHRVGGQRRVRAAR
jgi:hypothetical protein